MLEKLTTGFTQFFCNTGIAEMFSGSGVIWWKTVLMIVIACVLLYLAIVKKFEPLLLLPIAFGMLLANLPLGNVMHPEFFTGEKIDYGMVLQKGGLLDLLYLGVKLGIYPPLIFLGIGCMTDFAPLISNPKSILLGAAAQIGVFITFLGAILLGAFQSAFDVLLQSGALLLHAHAQIAPQIEGIHGGTQARRLFLIVGCIGAVGERKEIQGQTGIVIQCDRIRLHACKKISEHGSHNIQRQLRD